MSRTDPVSRRGRRLGMYELKIGGIQQRFMLPDFWYCNAHSKNTNGFPENETFFSNAEKKWNRVSRNVIFFGVPYTRFFTAHT